MTPAEQFEAFNDLKEVIGVTDEELALLLKHNCSQAPMVNYEDALIELLTRWLRYMTGIPWVRAFQHGARPNEDETGVTDGQYGTVQLLSWKPRTRMRYDHLQLRPDGTEYADFCEEYAFVGCYEFQLDVFRDAGIADKGQEGAVQQPVGSAIDVLVRASIRMYHQRWRDALKQYCVKYEDNALCKIFNLPMEKVKETFESRAVGRLKIFASPASSMRVPGIPNEEFAPFDWVCPPEQPDPTPPEPC